MNVFEVPPEYCFIARAFGQTRSLREAARVLDCDPASLVRKAQRAAHDFKLLRKVKGRWALTEFGQRSIYWLEQSIHSQKLLLSQKSFLRITTMMWFAEQVMIPNLDSLQKMTSHKFLWDIQTTHPNFENQLLSGASDYVISWHPPLDPAVAHKKIMRQNWIIVAPKAWDPEISGKVPEVLQGLLAKRPFIRHATLNPKATVDFDVNDSDFIFDSFITVRTAIESGMGWSCVPEILVRSSIKFGQISKLNLPVKMRGDHCLWWLRDRKDCEKNVKTLTNWLVESCSRN